MPYTNASYETKHRHKPRRLGVDADLPGERDCPLCSPHDHKNTEPFGYTIVRQVAEKPNPVSGDRITREHRIPVPAWHFTCQECRRLARDSSGPVTSLEGVAATCDTWTPAGARWRHANPELFPGQLPLAMDDLGTF